MRCKRCNAIISRNYYCRKCARLLRLLHALPRGLYRVVGYDVTATAEHDEDYFAALRGNVLDRGAVLDFVSQGDFYGLTLAAPNGMIFTITDTLIIGVGEKK